MKDYKKFITSFMNSWKRLEGAKTCELFAEKLKYYETPLDAPLCTKAEVVPLWEVVPKNQKDISYTGKILFEDDSHCFYHFNMTRTMTAAGKTQEIDGIMEIKLNAKNQLTYFKQWRAVKEK